MSIVVLKVYRDASGTVINIGDWDYQYQFDYELGEDVAANPLPAGATFADGEVEIMPDGSRRVLNP